MDDMFTVSDEDFKKIHEMVNEDVMDCDSTVGCLIYSDNASRNSYLCPIMSSYAESFPDKTKPIGKRTIKAELGEDEEYNRRVLSIIGDSYSEGRIPNCELLIIDYRLLKSDEVIKFLNDQYNKRHIAEIRIIGEDYTLDEDTYRKIGFFNTITAYNSSVNHSNVEVINKTLFPIYGNDHSSMEWIVREDISDEDIADLVAKFNATSKLFKSTISLRFYNPVVAAELIERLDKAGLDKSIDIEMFGYTLTEKSEIYNKIRELSNTRKIDVTYVCCHDLLNNYCHEPFSIDNSYSSELEPGGKTSLKTYAKILEYVEDFERRVRGVKSNTEKIMMAYDYINEKFGYALNSGNDKNYGDTRDLDKIIDSDEVVCVGFANMLTLLCRRVGIPMFTFSAPGHRMNVARVIEKDENGNVIFDKICTFDCTNDCGYYIIGEDGSRKKVDNPNSYTFFGLDPARWLYDSDPSFLTLANMLAIPQSEVENYSISSRSPFLASYYGYYNCKIFAESMLKLMGYKVDGMNLNDVISTLQREGRIGEITDEMIGETARNIERKKHPEMSDQEFFNHMQTINDRISDSIVRRHHIFTSSVARILIKGNIQVNVNTYKQSIDPSNIDINSIDGSPIYYENISDIPSGVRVDRNSTYVEDNENIDLGDNIVGTKIRKPRERKLDETEDEYIEYLRDYYGKYFSRYSLVKEEIIQDLPLHSKDTQVFNAQAMTDIEIEDARRRLF